ncbi:MAG: hypothetical protein HY558_02800 [Euryarchaeota archaeon]|nr:hypothetical protein [Euryarchaeota archaeon]
MSLEPSPDPQRWDPGSPGGTSGPRWDEPSALRVWRLIGVLFAGSLLVLGYLRVAPLPVAPEEMVEFPLGPLHWHANVSLVIHGTFTDLPEPGPGEPFVGVPTIHTHGDNRIHIEGVVDSRGEITLGRFFDVVGIALGPDYLCFNSTGKGCPDGIRGPVRVSINGRPPPGPRNHLVRDGDEILVRVG